MRALHVAAAAALCALLGACASVPDIDRYLLQSGSQVVRLEGSRGPLTYAQSRRIIEDLKRRSPESAVLERHIAIEEALTGTPLSVGNNVVLLEDGTATYAAMLAAIKAAKHHVHFEMYIFEADDTGREFAEALMAKRRAGLQVRLVYDSVGSINTPKSFFKELSDAGIEVVEYNPVNPATVLTALLALQHRDHRKLLIVDGRVAVLGGINISEVYGGMSGSGGSGGGTRRGLGGSGGPGGSRGDPDPPFEKRPWRDLSVRVNGPVVEDLQRAFLRQWEKQTKAKLDDKSFFPQLKPEGPHVVRAIADEPAEKGISTLYVALISAIESSETEVRIVNAYFVPHPQLREALTRAARRGVDVRLMLPSRSDNPVVYHAGRSYYDELLEAGVKIFERKSRVLHSKTATVDGVWSVVGSTNLDWRSLLYNDELNTVVLGPEFAARTNAVFEKDLADSEEITRDAWKNRPLADRLKEMGARSWAYFL
jgi:cardiolipin synthase